MLRLEEIHNDEVKLVPNKIAVKRTRRELAEVG